MIYQLGTLGALNVCRILDLIRIVTILPLVVKSFQSFTDDGINEFANISVRLAMISLSNAFRRG